MVSTIVALERQGSDLRAEKLFFKELNQKLVHSALSANQKTKAISAIASPQQFPPVSSESL